MMSYAMKKKLPTTLKLAFGNSSLDNFDGGKMFGEIEIAENATVTVQVRGHGGTGGVIFPLVVHFRLVLHEP